MYTPEASEGSFAGQRKFQRGRSCPSSYGPQVRYQATSLPVIPAAQVTGELVGRHGRRLFIIDYQALPCGCALKFGLENAKDLLALTVETDVVRKSGPLVEL